MHWLLFYTVLRYKTAIKAFRSKLLPFAQLTTHTLLNKNQNREKARAANVRYVDGAIISKSQCQIKQVMQTFTVYL